MSKKNIILIVSLFTMVLIGLRILWLLLLHTPDQPHVVKGQIDLRNWDFEQHQVIGLDGEWLFYPQTWIEGERKQKALIRGPEQYIQVPGTWNKSLQTDRDTPYGYGSYRLRILVDPNKAHTYSIRVASVRSTSEIYINHQLARKVGQPGENSQQTTAFNIPYTVTLTADQSPEIDVVIQVANFVDARDSGIIRAIKFGTEDGIKREVNLSATMQLITAIVFMMHAVYIFVLYFMGYKDKRLLYVSLFIVCMMFVNMLGGDEKLLTYWLQLGYIQSFKWMGIFMIGVAFSLMQCIRSQLTKKIQKVITVFNILCGISVLWIVIEPNVSIKLNPIYTSLFGIAAILSMLTMLRTVLKNIKNRVILLLATIAFMHHLIWWGYLMATGIKIIYYPFDLIICMFCFVLVSFQHYFQLHFETKELAAKLQKVNKNKDEFLASTSHELRNPLHSILNMTKAVLDQERQAMHEKSAQNLETVLSVGHRMSLMLNDLLDVMRLQETTLQLQRTSFSMQTIVSGLFDMLRYMTEGKSIKLVNQMPKDFPSVLADENRVIQIVFNLLHNAIKYTNEGEVSIAGYIKNDMAHIVISDTGIGIEPKMLQRVFEPYEQTVYNQTAVDGGFGLGLNITKKLVELHGGTIEATSVFNQGSQFVFTLPLSEQNELQHDTGNESLTPILKAYSTDADAIIQNDRVDSTSSLNCPKVLVVDDDPINLKVIHTILSVEKYDILTVTSGKKALDVLHTQEWDLVISDVMMPYMSGYELTRMIRKQYTLTDLPILLLTARSQPADIQNGFLAGANDYVIKPVDALELRSRVKALAEVRHSVKERLRMEAAWLQAQIKPHFLFNTLNTIIALSEMDMERTRNLLEAFCDYLDESFKFQNIDELVPLESELRLVRSYLTIEQERFGDRLQVTWEVEDCGHWMLPSLTIQPLVENAIKHGVMPQEDGGHIHIKVLN